MSGAARLEEAVAAYRAALEERTREATPYWHDITQQNLAQCLASPQAVEFVIDAESDLIAIS